MDEQITLTVLTGFYILPTYLWQLSDHLWTRYFTCAEKGGNRNIQFDVFCFETCGLCGHSNYACLKLSLTKHTGYCLAICWCVTCRHVYCGCKSKV